MTLRKPLLFVLFLLVFFSVPFRVAAEDKSIPGGMIPKLPKTANDPELLQGHVYPNWGPPCQRYTYSVVYRDKAGRAPTSVQIYFNGQMIDLTKGNPADSDYQKGVKYIYQYVPNKIGSNFYYFEASNGLGKARASIIDSPDNGPVLFTTPFDKNEIAAVEKASGEKILSYATGKEWVGGVALSDDGRYLAAKTSQHIYLFDLFDELKVNPERSRGVNTTQPAQPLWSFACEQCWVGDDVKGGVAISGDGAKIFAAFGERVALFDRTSNQPLWWKSVGNSYNVAISADGQYVAAATAGDGTDVNSNLLILWRADREQPLWQYHAAGNFHDVSLTADGAFVAGATGCPDRRFYLFSRDSNQPLLRTDPLTRDSPVHRAKISADGMLAAVGSEADAGAVFLFSRDKGPLWKFPTPGNSSVRALSFTPDGQYIGAATFGGDVYLFAQGSNQPINSWQVAASVGGVDIADDGSFLAAGGTDKKLHIFARGTQAVAEVPFDEYLEEVDIAANGRYIAAGTGGAVYFFETYLSQDRGQIFDCSQVIEPPSEREMLAAAGYGGEGAPVASSLCGDDRCEGPETLANCRRDCDPNFQKIKKVGWGNLAKLAGGGFLGALLLLGAFWVTMRRNRKVLLVLGGLAVGLALLTLGVLVFGRIILQTPVTPATEVSPTATPRQPEGELEGGGASPGAAVCGNNMCEPDFGETQETCPPDCSAGD